MSPLRLLVLADRDVRGSSVWPQVWEAAACVFAGDLYAALAEMVLEPGRFDGLVIDARCMTTQLVGAVGLIRKHAGLAVWLLESQEGRRTLVAQAMAQGAMIAGQDVLEKMEPHRVARRADDLATELLRMPMAPQAKTFPVTQSTPDHPPKAEPPLTQRAERRTIRDFTESAQEPIESEPADNYHGVTLQPVLTEEELRALLGSEP